MKWWRFRRWSIGEAVALVALVAVALLPLLADALRGETARCSQDGVVVDPAYAVIAEFDAETTHRFCGVACADRWMLRSGKRARSIAVTDCNGGGLIDARTAVYVNTLAGRREGVPDPIRVFASREEALEHVRAYGGAVLEGTRRPLRNAIAVGRTKTADTR